jgi:transglutaminase-like putative cysteine protease
MVRAGEGGGEVVPEGRLAEVKAEYLKASAMLDTRDEEIIKLAGAIDLTGLDAPAAAERVRRFVHKYIKAKDMSVGFATASEVCRTRTGDCTEHAVLLAALLRAKGVPARVVSGLIYIDEFAGKKNVFGYHMWSQALVDGQWVNLDATLGEGTPYDAAHITLSVSSLNEGEVQNFLVATAPLIGKLNIEVVKVE